jgi:beta-galactosidase
MKPERPTLMPGCSRILHGADYNPDQWLDRPDILAEDRRLRKLAGCNVFSIGIFTWSRLEPSEGVFEFGWLDRVMDDLAEDGCRAILSTPTAARPPWLAHRYPEVMRVNRAGRREPYGSRHNFCWTSPVFREKAREILVRLAERYATHPALGMWHVSNELGGCEGNGECLCEGCLRRWQGWLERRYGTLDALNSAWWADFWSHRFSAWDQVQPVDGTLDACGLDWSRFVNELIRDWIGFESAILRPITPGIPVTTNFMGIHPWMDYALLAEAVDLVADDQYPFLHIGKGEGNEERFLYCAFKHDLQRCYKPGLPVLIMESCPETPQWQRPQALKHEFLHRAEMLQAIGHGAEGVSYFQWRKGRGGMEKLHGAVVDHVGTEHTRTFQMIRRLSATLEEIAPVLGSRVVADVALLFDHDTRRAIELTSGAPKGGAACVAAIQEYYRPFWRRGVGVDIFDSRRTEWEQHRLVLAPHLFLLHPGVAERLTRFVQKGGVLVLSCLTGWVDASNRCLTGGFPGDGLRALCGLWMEELDELPEETSIEVVSESGWNLPGGRASRLLGMVHPEGAEVVARYGPGPFLPCGQPAILRQSVGAGTVWFVGSELDRHLLNSLSAVWMHEAGILPLFPDPLPGGVIFARRFSGDSSMWFVMNTGSEACSLSLPEGCNASALSGAGLFNGSVQLAPRSDVVLQVSGTGATTNAAACRSTT